MNVQSFSEVGGHRHNEDAFVVRQHPLDSGLWLCFVADGQGGQAGGGPAARLACDAGLAAAVGSLPERLSDPRVWADILQLADGAVRDDAVAGFTTLVGLCVSQRWVVGASSGDSAALQVCGERAFVLTVDQQKNPPVGSGAAVAVPFASPLSGRWQVLAMTDGVWKYVGWGRINETARRLRGEALVAELQRSARLRGSRQFQDDFTVVIMEGEVE